MSRCKGQEFDYVRGQLRPCHRVAKDSGYCGHHDPAALNEWKEKMRVWRETQAKEKQNVRD